MEDEEQGEREVEAREDDGAEAGCRRPIKMNDPKEPSDAEQSTS